jgi:hypothetical protein
MIDAVNEAIYNKLNGASGVTTLLSSATSIYFMQAPTTATIPYIIYILAGGGEDNDSPIDAADLKYYIRGVATNPTRAGAIATAIRAALHETTPAIDAPWTIYRCQHDAPIMYSENVDRDQFWHAGGSYRIRLSQ